MTTAFNSPEESRTETVCAPQIFECARGYAWSADATGSFPYVCPDTFAFLGQTRLAASEAP
jgi:hypothetical protein